MPSAAPQQPEKVNVGKEMIKIAKEVQEEVKVPAK